MVAFLNLFAGLFTLSNKLCFLKNNSVITNASKILHPGYNLPGFRFSPPENVNDETDDKSRVNDESEG